MKIAIVTVYDKSYEEIAAITRPIMEEYCQKHGYIFNPVHKGASFKYYEKIKIFKALFDYTDIECIFYLDIDILITNLTQKVEYFLDEAHKLYVCRDFNEINFGSCILVKSNFSEYLYQYMRSMWGNMDNEQNVLNHLYTHDPDRFCKYIKILEHPSINSMGYSHYHECVHLTERQQGCWHPGDFVLHVPALDLKKRAEVLSNAKDKIVR